MKPSDYHILLVEDNIDNQVLVRQQLQNMGYHCDVAEDGEVCVQQWRDHHYDLILMDCNMPRTDGFEACEQIRQEEVDKQTHIPIIAFTANTDEADIAKCFLAGMDDYLAKPFIFETMVDKLTRWLPTDAH